MTRRRLFKILASAVLAALFVAGWIAVGPRQLGGRASFAVIVGTSMEPKLHRGDLVVLHEAGGYRVGDVVAYRSALLHRTVLHRIVAERGGHYVLKGDNNDFLDPDRPDRGRVLGKQWVRVPGVGARLEQLRTPRAAALFVGFLVLLSGLGAVLGCGEPVGEPREAR